jgi:DNA-binding CsgD family transcriptional regulator
MKTRRTLNSAFRITPAEAATLDVLSERLDFKWAAERLGITPKALALRTKQIREKLFVDTTAQAVAEWKERDAA